MMVVNPQKFFPIIICIICLSGNLSCVKMKGDFAFKKFQQDTYHRINGPIEFPSSEPVQWVFVVRGAGESATVGVILQKKEIVWVDIHSRKHHVTAIHNAIYGNFDTLEPGEYKLVVIEFASRRLIDEISFRIY